MTARIEMIFVQDYITVQSSSDYISDRKMFSLMLDHLVFQFRKKAREWRVMTDDEL